MSAILVEFVVILLLVLVNGVFAMSELAIVSARKSRLKQRGEHGDAGARVALELAESPNRFLSTVQIGITLVGVLAGAFGGATLASVLSDAFADVPALAAYNEALGLAVVVLMITYMSLVIGELVPKQIAIQDPERVAAIVARPMRLLSVVVAPFVGLLSASTGVIMRLLRIQPGDEPPVTEEEIRILMDQGTRAGVFETVEQDLVESVFQLDDRYISAFMTPHTDLVWLDVRDTPDKIRHTIRESGHSHFLVCAGGLDQVLGVVHTKDLLIASMEGTPLVLADHLHPPHFVPENVIASRVITLFKQRDTPLLVVIDEHGGVQGIVTQHDLLEAFVGDMPSPGDPAHDRAVLREDGSWLFDGLLHIDEVKERLDLNNLPKDEAGVYETLGGFMMSVIGRIPTEGDKFEWSGWIFEIVDMDQRRVDKVLAHRVPISYPGDLPSAGPDQRGPAR